MYAERIEVLHVADGDAGVGAVADDLVLDLFPAAEVLLDHYLPDRAGLQAALGHARQFIRRPRDAAARSAECVGGADHDGIADLSSAAPRILDRRRRLARQRGDLQVNE